MIIVAMSFTSQAQEKLANFPNWVVESNIKTPRNSTIKFYNEKQELIYQETITGKKINISNKRVQKGLNSILKQLVAKPSPLPSSNLIMASLKKWYLYHRKSPTQSSSQNNP